MKKFIIITVLLTIGTSLTMSTDLFGQEVFGQQPKANTLTPVDEMVEMEYDDLPEPVRKVLKTDKYARGELDKIYKVGKRKAQREDHYTIRFKSGDDFIDVYLDENGNVIDPQDSDNETNN